jgi:acetyl-CoA acetyltransferase
VTGERREVVVAGVGQTNPAAEDPRSIPEMVLAAVLAAVDDSGLDHGDIDAVVTASVDLFDGLTASNVALTEVVGAVGKPETRIAADGLCALVQGACELWSGAYDTVLVVAHSKPSMVRHRDLTAWAMDPIYLQPLGVDFLVCAALEARLVAGGDVESASRRWAELAARRLSDAGARGVRGPLDAREILASGVVASPIREKMCAPLADGAVAVVLRVRGRDRPGPAVRLAGVGYDLGPHAPGDRDLRSWDGLRRACGRAFAHAGLGGDGSPVPIDLYEPSCAYPHEEELFRSAASASPDALLSPTGGLWAGLTPVAAGLSRAAAATRWLRERPGAGTARALAHGTWGPAGQGQVVAVLEASS